MFEASAWVRSAVGLSLYRTSPRRPGYGRVFLPRRRKPGRSPASRRGLLRIAPVRPLYAALLEITTATCLSRAPHFVPVAVSMKQRPHEGSVRWTGQRFAAGRPLPANRRAAKGSCPVAAAWRGDWRCSAREDNDAGIEAPATAGRRWSPAARCDNTRRLTGAQAGVKP